MDGLRESPDQTGQRQIQIFPIASEDVLFHGMRLRRQTCALPEIMQDTGQSLMLQGMPLRRTAGVLSRSYINCI